MAQRKWMRGLQRLTTTEETRQFLQLWSRLNSVTLSNREDELTWRFSANGEYSARSAYAMQFAGSFADYNWSKIWTSKTENRCKLFCWLFLQNKSWTADRIIKFGGQANPICQLCRTNQESALHLVAECSYAEMVWRSLASWIGVRFRPPPSCTYRRLRTWWDSMLTEDLPGTTDAHTRLQKMIYVIWNIWKERCRRVYDNKAMPSSLLQAATKE
jgi:hypothetical protein